MKHRKFFRIMIALAATVVCAYGQDGTELAKRQCRSVHLGYQGGPADAAAAYVEVKVDKSAPGTYYCALGFNKGYIGMQELANGKKVMIFSVWEPNHGQNQNDVPEEKRTKLIRVGEGVRTGRFGGEGTGGQSFYDYDWQVGESIKFCIKAQPEGDSNTRYTGWFFDNKRKVWQLMTEFRTITKGERLGGGLYSFVEDFRRNYESALIERVAQYHNGWAMDANGTWTMLKNANFTADGTPSETIDAGPVNSGFFLATGGKTTMKTTQLWAKMTSDKGEWVLPATVKPLIQD